MMGPTLRGYGSVLRYVVTEVSVNRTGNNVQVTMGALCHYDTLVTI
jgi:hypothetical protein